ncbi:MAG: type IX secretion system protein PorQ [Cytophagales bacterium]|nr:type IX secretion system protein PorQ [Cytophagales bacterium]
MKKQSLFLLLSVLSVSVWAQIGGRSAFNFLALHTNARIAGIGGENVSSSDKDVNAFMYNPALLEDTVQGDISINYTPFYSGVHKTDVTYGLKLKKLGTIGVGLSYVGYGEMKERNIAGQEIGTFSPRDYALVVGKSHQLEYFNVGANVKFAFSHIQQNVAFAMLADIGGTFKHPKKDFSVGLLFKNIGWVIDNYVKGQQSYTPFDIQLGLSYKLEHMPLRLSLTAHHLNLPDIQYIDPDIHTTFTSDGEIVVEDKNIAEQIGRHLVIGGEFLFSKNFNIRVGYNHQRRAEMIVENRSALTGFSFGGMLRIKSFEFAYTRAFYYVGGGVSMMTLTTSLNAKFKRKNRKKTKEAQLVE